jgi:hypothetical protein
VRTRFDAGRTASGYPWGSCEAQDRLDDMAGDATYIVRPGAPLRAATTREIGCATGHSIGAGRGERDTDEFN